MPELAFCVKCIIIVLIAHFQQAILHHPFFGLSFLIVGQHGVSIFFVLSGYLITSKLLEEQKIDLKQFYIRRFFRIVPAAAGYLLFLYALTWLTPMKVISADFWQSLFFFRNYVEETATNTCTLHFWSLSMEEQFYFIWPLLLAVLKPKRAAFAALSMVSVVVLLRHFMADYYLIGLRAQHTEVRADALLVGCLLAFMLRNEAFREWIHIWRAPLFCAGLLVFCIDVARCSGIPPLHEQIAIAIMIGSTVLAPTSLPARFLELEHLRTTGFMSYSLYLWQELFLRDNWGVWAFILLPAASLGSWLLIERPAIRFGRAHFDSEDQPALSRLP